MPYFIKALIAMVLINTIFNILLNLPRVKRRSGYTYPKFRYVLTAALVIGTAAYFFLSFILRFDSKALQIFEISKAAAICGVISSLFAMMVTREVWKKHKFDQKGRYAVDGKKSLATIVEEIRVYFPDAPLENIQVANNPDIPCLVFFIRNDSRFIEHDDSFESKINPFVSLAQIKEKAGKKDPEMKKTEVFWSNGQAFVSIRK